MSDNAADYYIDTMNHKLYFYNTSYKSQYPLLRIIGKSCRCEREASFILENDNLRIFKMIKVLIYRADDIKENEWLVTSFSDLKDDINENKILIDIIE